MNNVISDIKNRMSAISADNKSLSRRCTLSVYTNLAHMGHSNALIHWVLFTDVNNL